MKLICPNCRKTYQIDPNKIPSNVTTAKCKGCGHSISVNPRLPIAAQAKSSAPKITCMYCSKSYRIDRTKVPEDVTSTKCRLGN